MSPTSDDLRALLTERADGGPVTEPFDASTAARLAGVRARIRQRRRARAAASALAVVLVAGSATAVTARLRQQIPDPQPAHGVQLPARDLQGRPLAAQVQAQARAPGTTRFVAGWPDLHLALRCSGPSSTTAVTMLDGRAVAHTTCGGPGGDVTIDAEQARGWGLTNETISTVSVLLVRTPPRGGLLQLSDHTSDAAAEATVGVYTTHRVETGGYLPGMGKEVVLGGTSLPVTAGLGPRSLVVVPGSGSVHIERYCRYTPDRAYTLVVTVDGRRSTFPCGGSVAGDATESIPTPTRSGRPVRVTMEVTSQSDAGPGTPRLGETLPGAVVGVSVTGQPYLPDALQRTSLLSPPEVDAQGRPLVLSLIAGRGRGATATVRTAAGEGLAWQTWCTTAGGAVPELSVGPDRPTPGCGGEGSTPEVSQGTSGADGQVDVRLGLSKAGPEAGAVLALYGRGTVLRVVQQAAGATDPAALVTTTPPAPPLDGNSLLDRKEVLTAWLVVRGGQLLSVGTGPSSQYSFTVACTGTGDPVTAVVFVDGPATAGDQGVRLRCGSALRDAADNGEDRVSPRRVELSVLGPESALVTVGVYEVAVDLP